MENKNQQFSIKLDIDGNELIHSLEIISETNTYKDISKELHLFISKSKIEKIYNLTLKDLSLIQSKLNLSNLFMEKILGKLRHSIASYKGDQGGILALKNVALDELLCRCKGITYSDIGKLFKEFKGDRKGILIDSEVSGVCGTCRIDFDSYFNKLDEESGYINGIEAKKWEEKIYASLDDFYMICPPEYSDMKFNIISLNSHTLKIKCDRGESKLKRLDIQKTLSNYLLSELKIDVKLSVIT